MNDKPESLVTGVCIIAMYVTDLERSLRFYVDELGFQEKQAMPPGIIVESGNASLYIEGGMKECAVTEGRAKCAPTFETRSVRRAHALLKENGLQVSELQIFGETFATFIVADPDGNLIEFAGAP